MKKALITGIAGQDGSYLAEYLLSLNYKVHGIVRRNSTPEHQSSRLNPNLKNLETHYGDLSDISSLNKILLKVKPDEIYNLAAQSHVGVSFEQPEYTANVDAVGTLRILEAIRVLNLEEHTKVYQASTSELYGMVQSMPQNEKTPFYPRSPYAVAKMYAYWITVNYREAYGIFACNGILFNHESPRRGETFVTRKITIGATKINLGLQECLYMGNLDSKRDWGHAKDYVYAMWKMMQIKKPQDFVIGTGKLHSVKDFIRIAFEYVNLNYKDYIRINPKLFRPNDKITLKANFSKAKTKLKWKPKISFKSLVYEMVDYDIKKLTR